MISRSVEWPHYHVWTDALRGRDLARKAHDEWDRGTFVRWSMQSAWAAFEEEARSVLNLHHYGARFWDRFDSALTALGVAPPSRGSGLWQQMSEVYAERNKYLHLSIVDQNDLLLSDAKSAETAISAIRQAVHDLHRMLNSTAPEWIDDDVLPQHQIASCLTVGHQLRDVDDPRNIRITYLYADRESTPSILPPDADPFPAMHEVIKNTIIPISRVRAYRADDVIAEISVKMRGS